MIRLKRLLLMFLSVLLAYSCRTTAKADTAKNDLFYNSLSNTTVHKVLNLGKKGTSAGMTGIKISYDKNDWKNFIMEKTDTIQLKADITPNTIQDVDVIWSSSNSDVVKVDDDGVMTRTGYGYSTISVCTYDGEFVDTFPVKINGFGFVYGDISFDGKVTITDMAEVVSIVNGNRPVTEEDLLVLDLNGDGKITQEDEDLINSYVLKDIQFFPVESMVHDISVSQLPDKTKYTIGEPASMAGLTINVHYNNGQVIERTDGYAYSADTNEAGMQKVYIMYCENDVTSETSFYIEVEKKKQVIKGTFIYQRNTKSNPFYLDVERTEGNGILSYEALNTSVASVDRYGLVQVLGKGQCLIRVNSSETDEYKEANYYIVIDVQQYKDTSSETPEPTPTETPWVCTTPPASSSKTPGRVTPGCVTSSPVTPTPTASPYWSGSSPTPQPDDWYTPSPTPIPTVMPYWNGSLATPQPDNWYRPLPTPGRTPQPNGTSNSTPKVSNPKKNKLKKVGTIFSDKKTNLKYSIVKKGTITSGKVTGAQVECKAGIKKKNQIIIPDTVTWNGVTYQVVSISANVFKNNTKLKKISIGQNVKKIGKKAFYGCKNVKQLSIKSKQFTDKKIGKDSFAKMGKGMTVRIPKEKYAYYKKLLVKKGIR